MPKKWVLPGFLISTPLKGKDLTGTAGRSEESKIDQRSIVVESTTSTVLFRSLSAANHSSSSPSQHFCEIYNYLWNLVYIVSVLERNFSSKRIKKVPPWKSLSFMNLGIFCHVPYGFDQLGLIIYRHRQQQQQQRKVGCLGDNLLHFLMVIWKKGPKRRPKGR